jgi:uncharacterized protein
MSHSFSKSTAKVRKDRIVVDTNIYISAIVFGGTPDKIVQLGRFGCVYIFISHPIIDEIVGVLVTKFKWSYQHARKAIHEIKGFTHIVLPSVQVKVVSKDPSDNMILECAIECRAHFIVTGDKHLLALKKYKSTEILSAMEFLRRSASA